MQFYDILMIGVLVGTTVFGAWKGLAWQAASIASLIVSYFAALRFRDVIAPFVKADEPWNRFGAMLIIFIAVSLAIWLVFRYVSDVIDRVKLREFDRQLGALVGLAKGVLFCVVITFFAITLLEGARQPILDSRSGYYIAVLIDRADAVMPHEVHEVLGPYLHRLEDELEPTGAPKEGKHTEPSLPSAASGVQGRVFPGTRWSQAAANKRAATLASGSVKNRGLAVKNRGLAS
jgi:membrane protein required for colicin V production